MGGIDRIRRAMVLADGRLVQPVDLGLGISRVTLYRLMAKHRIDVRGASADGDMRTGHPCIRSHGPRPCRL